MRIASLECFAGISGDMLMAALVDAGASVSSLQDAAKSVGLGAELRISKVDRSGIQSTKIDVIVEGQFQEGAAASGPHARHSHPPPAEDHTHSQHDHPTKHHHHDHEHTGQPPAASHSEHFHGRAFRDIRSILLDAPLNKFARELSLTAFQLLAEAEGRIHGLAAEDVHFHEVGAVDAIVDIVCCAVAVEELALDRWYCSPVNVGGGFVDCAHGRFPVPAPATADLLMHVPTYSAGPQSEMVTPTGAALLRALNCRFESAGVIRSSSIGYGAGTRNPERFPNVLRLSIGELARPQSFDEEKVTVLECAIDDLSPQIIAYAIQRAMERGALDVMSSPVTMKKGRLGTLLTVLCKTADAGDLQELLFRETTTLGIRVREESRICLPREIVPVETEFGVVRVKVGLWRGDEMNAAPEFEDCRRAAEAHDVPLKSVMQAALLRWRRVAEVKLAAGAE